MESVVSSSEPRFSAFSLDSDKNGLLKLPQDTSKLKIVDPSVKASGYFSGLGYHTPVMTPLFLRPPHWSHINQQDLGNCWFLASICSILNLPDGMWRVMHMMRDVGEYVVVRLFDSSKTAHYLRLEKSVVYSLIGSQYHARIDSNLGTWPIFLEKALTAFDKSRNFDPGNANYGRTVGGFGEDGLALLLGVDTIKVRVNRPQLETHLETMKFKSHLISLFQGNLDENDPTELRVLRQFFGQQQYAAAYWSIWKSWLASMRPRDLAQELEQAIEGRQAQTRVLWNRGVLMDSPEEFKGVTGVFRLEHFKLWFERRNGRLNVIVAKALLDNLQHFNLLPGKRGTGIYAPSQLATFNYVVALYQSGTPATASTLTYLGRTGLPGTIRQYTDDTVKGLVPNHEYAIKSAFKQGNQCFIKLINPWGAVGRSFVTNAPSQQPNASLRGRSVAESEHAEFDLDLDDFTKRFSFVSHTNQKLRDLDT